MKKLTLIVLLTALILTGCDGPHRRHFRTIKKDLLAMPGNMWDDSKRLVGDPNNVGILILAGGASALVREEQDDHCERHFENHHAFPRDFEIAVGAAGNPGTHFIMAGAAYLYSLYAEDEHLHDVAGTTVEALALTGFYTVGLKLIAQDQTPNEEYYGWPSGHTSSTVAFATVMNEYYGPWVGLPLYALAGFVMYERMDTQEHWASDIVFGAAIGYTIGKTVADKYKPQLFGMDVTPYIDPVNPAGGIALSTRF